MLDHDGRGCFHYTGCKKFFGIYKVVAAMTLRKMHRNMLASRHALIWKAIDDGCLRHATNVPGKESRLLPALPHNSGRRFVDEHSSGAGSTRLVLKTFEPAYSLYGNNC
jgi:hypothetical protein